MTALTNQRIDQSFKDVLQISNSNAGIDGTLRAVRDGENTASVLKLSSTAAEFTGAVDFGGKELTLDSDGDSSLHVSTDDQLDIKLQGQDLFILDGTTNSSVNGLTLVAAATNNPARIDAQGSDTNIGLRLRPKGTGTVLVQDASGNEIADFKSLSSPINYLQVTASPASSAVTVESVGDDTNIGLLLKAKGSGNVTIEGDRVLTTADEGSGNGIDADTLDGAEGSAYAKLADGETVSGQWTFSSSSRPQITLSGSFAELGLKDTDAGADNKLWGVLSDGGAFKVVRRTDAGALENTDLQINQSGAMMLGAPTGGLPSTSGHFNAVKLLENNNAVLTTADEGSGNGIDADTVDGKEASSFGNAVSSAATLADGSAVTMTNPTTKGALFVFANNPNTDAGLGMASFTFDDTASATTEIQDTNNLFVDTSPNNDEIGVFYSGADLTLHNKKNSPGTLDFYWVFVG